MRHLDLGSGSTPKNPYHADEVFGIDLNEYPDCPNVAKANLALDPIPYSTDYFDSVSGFDFIEHVPRQVIDQRNGELRFCFVELMNEIYRVLKPGGMLYTVTPCFPRKESFQDPTHVNIITVDTHKYFCLPDPVANIYGFTGAFELVEARWLYLSYSKTAYRSRYLSLKNFHKRFIKRQVSHFVWQLRAVK